MYVIYLKKKSENTRGTLTEPGKESPYRNRAVEENLDLFESMKNGEFKDGEKVLRAKIDMASPNIKHAETRLSIRVCSHALTTIQEINGAYTQCMHFAHPLEDAIEGITHSICTLEFEDHRPLYDWVVRECRISTVRQDRLNLLNLYLTNIVVTGKR